MTRISLKEAYDNKDVVTQIFGLRDEVDKHTEILENLPDPDLTNCVLKTGDQTIDGKKTFTDEMTVQGVIHADGGLDLANMGPLTVNGNLEVNGDIIQNGSAYETHAEQVFSANDYIVTRDGAVGSLPAGAYSGIQVKKYDGTSDCRLVVDNTGTARVGDINDEQPLMTRDESASMSNGALLKWDGVNGKAVSSIMDNTPTADSVNAVTSGGIKTAIDSAVTGKVAGSGNIGSDVKPVKIVNGVAVEIADALIKGSGNIGSDNRPIKIVNGQAVALPVEVLLVNIDLPGVTAGVAGYPTIWVLRDQNGVVLMEFKLYVRADGGCNFYVRARNSGGTMTDINLAAPE